MRIFGPRWRAWEREVARRVKVQDASANPPMHTLGRAIQLFMRTCFARPGLKYDSVGVYARRLA